MAKKWLTIALAIALVAALAVGGAVISGKSRNESDLESRLTAITGDRDTAQTALSDANALAKSLQEQLSAMTG